MKAHFIGIGGIGMSALARYFLSRGVTVSGSDQESSPVLDELEKEGVTIFYGHDENNIHDDMYQVIYSEAIQRNNPERVAAKALNIQKKSYFAALGDISKTKTTLSVCGTHGKSTTTAMAGLMLEASAQNPLVILGTKVFEWGEKNIRLPEDIFSPQCVAKREGKDFFLVESCEYHNSFLHLFPNTIVVTNIEPDHLDFFGSEEKYFQAFVHFARRLPKNGVLIADFSNPKVSELFLDLSVQKKNISSFLSELPPLLVPGEHNRQNAASVLALASALGIPMEIAKQSLQSFRGTWRRFEKKGEKKGVLVFDDYAHHPTEIRATLRSLRELFPRRKIWAVFQPHQYSRTREFQEKFAQSFSDADVILIPNICRVRDTDEDVASITPGGLVKCIAKYHPSAHYTESFERTVVFLKEHVATGDIIISLGAGPVYKVSEGFLQETMLFSS
jgi:UDP-N-acetylmuramate--alanine ligase